MTTESRESLLTRFESGMFPGAAARSMLEVSAATTTVAIRLRLKASDWTTSTGRRYPSSDPCGSSRSAHQISPRLITNVPAQDSHAAFDPTRDPAVVGLLYCRPRSANLSPKRRHGVRETEPGLADITRYARCRALMRSALPCRTDHLEGRWRSSYAQYNSGYTG